MGWEALPPAAPPLPRCRPGGARPRNHRSWCRAVLVPACSGSRERRWERTTMNVEHEISLLVEEIRRLGTKNADGQVSVKFGVLFADEKCANLFEALVGTLKAAKRRKIVTYQGELLLQGNTLKWWLFSTYEERDWYFNVYKSKRAMKVKNKGTHFGLYNSYCRCYSLFLFTSENESKQFL
uniref:Costars family protein ABRACL n=1 Tax=Pavo cristatus TaxID=9049 RepID=A0A8C9G2Z2_PAVCR